MLLMLMSLLLVLVLLLALPVLLVRRLVALAVVMVGLPMVLPIGCCREKRSIPNHSHSSTISMREPILDRPLSLEMKPRSATH
jgi:hypothetical protein